MAELAETLDQQERDRIKDQVRNQMALESVKAEPVETSTYDDNTNTIWCSGGRLVWAAVATIVAVVMIAVLVVVRIQDAPTTSSTTTLVSSGDETKTRTTDTGTPAGETSAKSPGHGGGEKASSLVRLIVEELKGIKLFVDLDVVDNVPIDLSLLGQEDHEQLFQWTVSFWNESLTNYFASDEDKNVYHDLLVPDGWRPSAFQYGEIWDLFEIPTIQLRYEQDGDVNKSFDLYAFLETSTKTGLSTFIEKQQMPVGETRASLVVLRTIPAFGLVQVEPFDHEETSSLVLVHYTISFRVPNSTTREELFGVNDAKVTTYFLDQYSISADVHVLRTSARFPMLGTSCLPPDGQSTIVSYPCST